MRNLWTLALLALSAASTTHAQEADASSASIEPQARALLEAVGARYKSLAAYVDQGESKLRIMANGQEQAETAKKTLTFARPNKLNVVFQGVQYVTDGKMSTSSMADKYMTSGAPSLLTPEALASNPSAVYYFGGAPGIPSMAVLRLLTSDDPASTLLEGVSTLKLEADRVVDGKSLKCLGMKPVAGPLVRLMVDPTTMLLARVEVQPSADELPPGVTIEEMSWTSGPVSTDVPPDTAFVFAPGATQTKVESVAALMAGPGETEAPGTELEGKPAPDFKFQLVTATDQIRPVTSAELKGKVVLIDFWATWCGPCLQEMPEISKLTQAYAKGPNADKVRVLALSIDDGELSKVEEVRQLVASTLTELKLEPRVGSTGLLGLDPEQGVATAFGVEAIPMLVLIDAEGVVRKVHVGLEPDIRETLTREIDGLLQGKP